MTQDVRIYKQIAYCVLGDCKIPHCKEVLSVGNQNENLAIWYLHDPNAPSMTVFNLGTGALVIHDAYDRFIGTTIFAQGRLVVHSFTCREP